MLQQLLFELLAQEVDVLAEGLVVGGDAGAEGDFVHVARRDAQEVAGSGKIQTILLSAQQPFYAVETLLNG